MYEISIEDKLKEALRKLHKKNRITYEVIMNKMQEIIEYPPYTLLLGHTKKG